jgi:hypothetical protein
MPSIKATRTPQTATTLSADFHFHGNITKFSDKGVVMAAP